LVPGPHDPLLVPMLRLRACSPGGVSHRAGQVRNARLAGFTADDQATARDEAYGLTKRHEMTDQGKPENSDPASSSTVAELRAALASIANSSCCSCCQEAALVAKAALARTEGR
jgi:hypothetical protein